MGKTHGYRLGNREEKIESRSRNKLGTSLVVQGLKNLPANSEDTGSIPEPGRCQWPWSNEAHEPPLLIPRAREPTLCKKRNHGSEKPSGPCS